MKQMSHFNFFCLGGKNRGVNGSSFTAVRLGLGPPGETQIRAARVIVLIIRGGCSSYKANAGRVVELVADPILIQD